jgi:DGQHR domain-containing protein
MTDKTHAILIEQGDRNLLLFSLPASELLDMCYFNTREVDRQDGIQRDFKAIRSRHIAEFIDGPDPCLANNIILNIELDAVGLSLSDVFSKGEGSLDLRKIRSAAQRQPKNRPAVMRGKCAFVVDGQHRLRAFEFAERKEFPLVVTALIDLSLSEVAELFVQINFNQKPVNKSLVFDLLGLSPDMIPGYRELHDVVTRLNEDVESPFYRRIKMLGVGEGTISQASVITAVEKYHVRETLSDILNVAEVSPDSLYDVLWNYFMGVSGAFEARWEERGRLCRTIAVRALILVMVCMLREYHAKKMAFAAGAIEKDMKRIDIEAVLQRAQGFGGERGVNELARLLLHELELNHE